MRHFYESENDHPDDAESADDEPADDGLQDDAFDDDAFEDDESLDDEFPRGDGTADTTADVFCPYCGELNEIAVDPGGGSAQSYVEDCHVCCRPWRVTVAYDASGHATAYLETADD